MQEEDLEETQVVVDIETTPETTPQVSSLVVITVPPPTVISIISFHLNVDVFSMVIVDHITPFISI